ncbi:19472_t:CDS:2, partial [Gigaspora rosea]
LEKRCQELAPLSDELAVITDRVSDSNEIIKLFNVIEESKFNNNIIYEQAVKDMESSVESYW